MPDRAEELKEIEALDRRVDELLSEVEQTAERIDAAIPSPPEDANVSQFEDAAAVLEEVNADLARAETDSETAAEPVGGEVFGGAGEGDVESTEFESAADVMEEVAAELRATEEPAPPAELEASASEPEPEREPEPEPESMSAEEFSSPEAIRKLDERLAANASDLSAGTGDVVDDSEVQEQVIASERGEEPAPVVVSPEPVAASIPAAPAKPVAPALAPEPAPIAAPVVVVPAKDRLSIGRAAAAPLVPLANFTERLSPGTRQTIAYAAVVTLFQAACLWGFLVFKGPPGEPVPTSDPVTLREPDAPPKAKPTAGSSPKNAAESN
jgi:hypothetical protein